MGSKNWRKVLKTLALVEYLLQHGSAGVIDDCVAHSMHIAALSRFSAPRPAGAAAAACS